MIILFKQLFALGNQPSPEITIIQHSIEQRGDIIKRIDNETTANIGIIHGGIATNIIPDRVDLKGEARSRSEEKLSSQTKDMVSAIHAAALNHGGTVDIDVQRAYTGYTLTENDEVVRLIMDGMRSVGLQPILIPSGGGSDANIFNAAGMQVVNICTGMDRVHTTQERISLSDMVSAREVVLACLSPALE